MKKNKPKFEKKNRFYIVLIGLLLIIGNSCWLIYTTSLFYVYHFTKSFFYFILPTWVSIEEAIIAATGIFIGLQIIRNKIPAVKWLIIDLILVATGIIINFLAVR